MNTELLVTFRLEYESNCCNDTMDDIGWCLAEAAKTHMRALRDPAERLERVLVECDRFTLTTKTVVCDDMPLLPPEPEPDK